jgi:hypothetical protein
MKLLEASEHARTLTARWLGIIVCCSGFPLAIALSHPSDGKRSALHHSVEVRHKGAKDADILIQIHTRRWKPCTDAGRIVKR